MFSVRYRRVRKSSLKNLPVTGEWETCEDYARAISSVRAFVRRSVDSLWFEKACTRDRLNYTRLHFQPASIECSARPITLFTKREGNLNLEYQTRLVFADWGKLNTCCISYCYRFVLFLIIGQWTLLLSEYLCVRYQTHSAYHLIRFKYHLGGN